MAYHYYSKRRGFLGSLSVTNALILINVAAFVVFSLLLLTGIIPIDYIAIKPSNILQGKYLWTFITSMFMHGGFFHIFANMLSLFFVGSLIERILGPKRYLNFYLFSGLFSSVFFILCSLIIKSDFNMYAVGASGALFGLIGLLMILTPKLPVYIMFIPIPIKMKYAAPGMLFALWAISIAGSLPIGNTAHLGGLIAGIFYGIYLKIKFPRKTEAIKNMFK